MVTTREQINRNLEQTSKHIAKATESTIKAGHLFDDGRHPKEWEAFCALAALLEQCKELNSAIGALVNGQIQRSNGE